MPAWSFRLQFRGALLNGLAQAAGDEPVVPLVLPKRQTIRKLWQNGHDPKHGDHVRLWIAQRTPERELLGKTPPVSRARIRIELLEVEEWVEAPWPTAVLRVVLDGDELYPATVGRLARRDGFVDTSALVGFFQETHGLRPGRPFDGYLFRW